MWTVKGVLRIHRLRRPTFGLFVGLTLVYLTEIPTRFKLLPGGERLVGFWQLATGLWLMYLTFAVILGPTNGWDILSDGVTPAGRLWLGCAPAILEARERCPGSKPPIGARSLGWI